MESTAKMTPDKALKSYTVLVSADSNPNPNPNPNFCVVYASDAGDVEDSGGLGVCVSICKLSLTHI